MGGYPKKDTAIKSKPWLFQARYSYKKLAMAIPSKISL